MRREYVGGAPRARLTDPLGGTTAALTITCDNLTNFPTGIGGKPFFVVVDRNTASEEKILCSSRSGNVITVYNVGGVNGRGADDTSITTHSNNAVIEHVFTATDADEANAHINSSTNVHPQYVLESVINVKGDLLVGTANDTVSRQPAGTSGQILSVNPAAATGLAYVNPLAFAMSAATLTVSGLSIAPSDSVSVFGTINWPVGRFSIKPIVVIGSNENANATGGYKPIFTADSSAGSTTVYMANANSTTTITKASLNAIAIQMTSGSATG